MELPKAPDLTKDFQSEKNTDRRISYKVLWWFVRIFVLATVILWKINNGLNSKGSDNCDVTVKYLRAQTTALNLKVDLKQAEIDGIKESNRVKDSATLSSLNNRLEHDKRVDKITTQKK